MSTDLLTFAQESYVQELEQKILQARHEYYNGTPSVTDAIYDSWVDELAELKDTSIAVVSVGAAPVSAWPKVQHTQSMGSLDKVQTLDEMTHWVQTRSRVESKKPENLLVTEKLDGISVSLVYDGGHFRQALTRGDGHTGEDITPNVARMKGVPKELSSPISCIVRGEIILSKQDWAEYFPGTANTRNVASGTAKRLDGKGCEHLTVLAYQILDGGSVSTECDTFRLLSDLGFQTPNWFFSSMSVGVRTPQDIWISYQQSVRDQLPYDIDGLVVRLDDIAYQLSLGEKNGRPVGAVAFKFSAVTCETRALRRVDQVGGTGKITPVAEFEPVRILGARITRASLYNQRYVEQIGFYIGARIVVSRANDVIPRVLSVVNPGGPVSAPPEVCPECATPTIRSGEYIVCPNTGGCPAQTEGRIRQWVRELGILEWGHTLIQRVVETGLVRDVSDLYRLVPSQLAELDRMGDTSAGNAISQLWGVVPMPLEQFLGSLSIPLCATTTIQTLVDVGYDSLDKIRTATTEQLQTVPGFGPSRAAALSEWLRANGGLVDRLLEAGVTIKDRPVGVLTGKSVCFTGKSERKRADLVRIVEASGGSIKKSVGKGLTYLVLAESDSTSAKAQAARKNGVQCLTEQEFLRLVGEL